MLNEATEQFFQSWDFINFLLPKVSITTLIVLVLGFVIGTFVNMKNKPNINSILDAISDISINGLIVWIVISLLTMAILPNFHPASQNLKKAIEQEYTVIVGLNTLEQKQIGKQDVIETYIRSYNTEDKTSYKVYLVKIDNNWQLCKMDSDGHFTPIDANNTISDLKG